MHFGGLLLDLSLLEGHAFFPAYVSSTGARLKRLP